MRSTLPRRLARSENQRGPSHGDRANHDEEQAVTLAHSGTKGVACRFVSHAVKRWMVVSGSVHSNPSARLGDNVNNRWLAALNDLDCTPDCWAKIFGISDGAFPVNAHALCELRKIDVGILKRRANLGAVNPPIMPIAHPLDIHKLLM